MVIELDWNAKRKGLKVDQSGLNGQAGMNEIGLPSLPNTTPEITNIPYNNSTKHPWASYRNKYRIHNAIAVLSSKSKIISIYTTLNSFVVV